TGRGGGGAAAKRGQPEFWRAGRAIVGDGVYRAPLSVASGRMDERHRALDDGRSQAPLRNGLFAEQRDDGGGRRRFAGRNFSALREVPRADSVARPASAGNHGGTTATGRA